MSRGYNLNAARGTDLPWSKLDPEKVRKVRRLHARKMALIARINARYSITGLAKQFGVSAGAVEKALKYETWRHVL